MTRFASTCKPLLLVLMLSCVLFTGCSRDAELKGQIFVVTRGRENIKLGNVEVSVYLESALVSVKDEITKSLVEHKKRREAAVDEIRSIQRAQFRANGVDVSDVTTPQIELLREMMDSRGALFSTISSAGHGGLIAKTTTDADGRFSLRLPLGKGPFAIVAQSSRMVFDKKEQYYWLIEDFSLDGAKYKEIILSNTNLMAPM